MRDLPMDVLDSNDGDRAADENRRTGRNRSWQGKTRGRVVIDVNA